MWISCDNEQLKLTGEGGSTPWAGLEQGIFGCGGVPSLTTLSSPR